MRMQMLYRTNEVMLVTCPAPTAPQHLLDAAEARQPQHRPDCKSSKLFEEMSRCEQSISPDQCQGETQDRV